METVLDQSELSLKVRTPLSADTVILDRLDGIEGLSIPFEFILQLHSNKKDINFEDLLGQEITASLSTGKSVRYFSGIAGKVEQLQTIQNHEENFRAYYQVTIYSKFWLTKFTNDHRIFQNMSAIDIIKELLEENNVIDVENQVSTCGQRVREFCVQYGESVFDFVSRLMEEEGIFYFFVHTEEGHKMVLADNNQAAKPLESDIDLSLSELHQFHLNQITQFNYQKQIVIKEFKTVDFNYLTPDTQLLPQAPGNGLGGTIYEFPVQFEDMDSGESLANYRIQEQEWAQALANGVGTVPDFTPGRTFTLRQHPREDFNQEYMLYRIKHSIHQKPLPRSKSDEGQENENDQLFVKIYENEFSAFPVSAVFRSPRITHKKRVYSNQTAIVTGPDGEEVFCDEYGRIKIHFHWDIRNAPDENSSCWVRVLQNWAGSGWGGLVTPRIGMEVVVTFIEGDPDRPLVIGCVYNGKNKPPSYVNDSPTKSTFKTNSSKDGTGFNELRFEDKVGEEEIFTHAQKDVTTVIEDSRSETINDGSDTLFIKQGSKFVTLSGTGTLHSLMIATGNKSTQIGLGNSSVEIQSGNYSITLAAGNMEIKVNGNIKVKSTQNITFSALKNIELKAGVDVKIKAGKTIQSKAGAMIQNKAGSNIQSKAGAMIQNKAGSNIQNKAGAMIQNKAGSNIQNKAGAMIQNKAGAKIQNKAGSMIESKAGMMIQNKAGMNIQNKAGMMIESKAGMMIQNKAGMNIQNKAGMMADLKGGVMAQVQGGVMGQYKAGVMCMVKGVMTKIN